MAMIEPFRGIRYNLGHVGTLSNVVAPPYDVIDSSLQNTLYDKHQHNIIRIELNRTEQSDTENDKYLRAGKLWKHWQLENVLLTEGQPVIYALHQHYTVEGVPYVRKGFFARVQLERFGEGKIYPHEQTLSGPKEDRYRLMQATHANLSPVFGLYPDPEQKVQNRIDRVVERTLPMEATDHLGITSQFWPVQDALAIRDIAGWMHDKPIFIADGHHRYETAIRYRDELIKKQGPLPAEHPANFILMALVGMSDPGLLILPTHRLVQGFQSLRSGQLKSLLEPHFTVDIIGQGEAAAQETWERMQMDDSQNVLGFGTQADHTWLLAHFQADELMAQLTPKQSDAWRSLAVSRLHEVVLNHLLKDQGKPVCQYVHLLSEVQQAQRAGSLDLACLVPPATMQHVTDIAGQLEKMPPKSTYFYPKLLTGLVFHSLN